MRRSASSRLSRRASPRTELRGRRREPAPSSGRRHSGPLLPKSGRSGCGRPGAMSENVGRLSFRTAARWQDARHEQTKAHRLSTLRRNHGPRPHRPGRGVRLRSAPRRARHASVRLRSLDDRHQPPRVRQRVGRRARAGYDDRHRAGARHVDRSGRQRAAPRRDQPQGGGVDNARRAANPAHRVRLHRDLRPRADGTARRAPRHDALELRCRCRREIPEARRRAERAVRESRAAYTRRPA